MHRLPHLFLQVSPGIQPTFVIVVGSLVMLLSFFIVLQTIRHRHRKNIYSLEKELLKKAFGQELLLNKVEVQEATFEALGKELHDNVGQLLSSAKMLIGVTERSLQPPPDTLLSANETLNKAIIELRSLSKALNREWLEQFDMLRNISVEIERFQSGVLDIHFDYDDPVKLVPQEQFMLFRVIQEALQNVLRHAEANRIDLRIFDSNNASHIIISDNGKGLARPQDISGVGISNMKQRVHSLGGTIGWQSSQGGTIVSILIPYK